MGLDLCLKDSIPHESFHISYGGFDILRREILKAYDRPLGELYETIQNFITRTSLSSLRLRKYREMSKEMKEICNEIDRFETELWATVIMNVPEPMAIFINHSDCDGTLELYDTTRLFELLTNDVPSENVDEEWRETYVEFLNFLELAIENESPIFFN